MATDAPTTGAVASPRWWRDTDAGRQWTEHCIKVRQRILADEERQPGEKSA